MAKHAHAIIALNACGWVLILASACYNQNKVGRKALNFPLDHSGADMSSVATWQMTGSAIMRGAASKWPAYGTVGLPAALPAAALSPGGKALSYLWWVTFFQFFGVALSAAAVKRPNLRIGAVGVFAVLTATTFIYTADCYSAPVTGLFALTHDRNLDIIVPSSSNQPALHAYYKGLAVLVAGLVTCDVMNILTMLVLPTIAAEEEKPAAEGKVVESAV